MDRMRAGGLDRVAIGPETRLADVVFPELEPFDTGMLPVGDGHALYYEQVGAPDGIPVVYLHGGPGGGVKPTLRRYFDPRRWRVILFDQRGCGKSTPRGSLAGNDTPHLVADIEALRRHLGIERWAVTGGSWGSCLSLAYGQAHPDRALGFILRGVFLGEAREIDWWWNSGTRALFPAEWEAMRDFLPEGDRGDILAGYQRRLASNDPAVYGPAAQAMKAYSGLTSIFRQQPIEAATLDPDEALPIARLFTTFCVNRFWLADGQLLRGLARIAHLPCQIVQGRYDVVTPARSAWEVHKAWPGSEIEFVIDSNHTIDDPGPAAAWIRAQDRLLQRLAA